MSKDTAKERITKALDARTEMLRVTNHGSAIDAYVRALAVLRDPELVQMQDMIEGQ